LNNTPTLRWTEKDVLPLWMARRYASCIICEEVGSAWTRHSCANLCGWRVVGHSTCWSSTPETPEQDTGPQRTRRMPAHLVDYPLDKQCHKGGE
jgi:hypothetical protein